MNLIPSIIIHTANILGAFTDPFEFEGDYGSEMNSIRQQVFERVISHEALAKNLSDWDIKQQIGDNQANDQKIKEFRKTLIAKAIHDEKTYGPTLA